MHGEVERDVWTRRAALHVARLEPYVAPHLRRRDEGIKHPVHDFLFTYYSFRPAQLLRWHPGFGVRLIDAPEYDDSRGYQGGTVAAAYVAQQRPLIESLHRVLTATAGRTANFGCFGLHEWAMVHRADETRHPVPLRLGAAGTDAVVEQHRIACSHFDAYRFFTPSARPFNTLNPGRDDRAEFEQPACLHAGMDLYKMAFRLSPLIDSDLVADCFELAWDIRILDMRAAPYDMTGWTLDPTGEPWTPVPIETADGKAEYVEAQRGFAARGEPLRRRLIRSCEALLDLPVAAS
ncbi:3-methyladenine DNA glycosylase [Nocardioides sp. R-C-SC26]|uniref:3-methyladenine DNA glycosylase n=1 Tax=Nocardioides sp. R-C-SC26 TaxID=2870414 RepID=UPI001E53A867|nr:3-methyladenine DNA glycosylase [Nocardioides sp. R-C-SC26]